MEMPVRFPAPGALVDLGEVTLWTDDQGDGEPLVLLGGFSAGHFIWDFVRPYLEGFRTITLEPRGLAQHGNGIMRAGDFDQAVEFANSISFGLSAGVVTTNLQRAFQFANRIEAGVVKVNEPTTGLALQAPFGGFKQSSANTFKEQGQAAIEFYTRTKTVYVGHG